MKKLTIIIALVMTSIAGYCQKKSNISPSASGTHFSLGLETGLPIGVYHNSYSFALGGTLQVEHFVAPEVGLTFNTGYVSYLGKTIDYYGVSGKVPSEGFIPLLAGVKYYFAPSVFGHAQLGLAIGTAAGVGTHFSYSPGIGYKISQNFDAELKYTGISSSVGTLSDIGLRLAYNF